MSSKSPLPDRRDLLARGAAGLLGASALSAVAWRAASGREVCVDGAAERTPHQIAGPFYLTGAPFQDDLRVDGMEGEDLTMLGQVLDGACRPVADAVLDVWQADPAGAYDNDGFRLRGKVRVDGEGRYRFLTLKPGRYGTGFVRTPHLHVRIQAEGMRQLTTQIYFPDEEEQNARDSLYRPELLMAMSRGYAGLSGTFNFVMEPG